MTTIVALPTARELFIDPSTGENSRFWYRFLSDLFNRVGGIEASSVGELATLLSALTVRVNGNEIDLSFNENISILAELTKIINDLQREISTPFNLSAELQKQINDLYVIFSQITDPSAAIAEFSKRGDYSSASLAVGFATALTTTISKSIINITLSAGDWDVDGVIDFKEAATTSTNALLFGTSTTNNTLGADDTYGSQIFPTAGQVSTSGDYRNSVPTVRYILTVPTTIYLVAQATFAVSTMTSYGTIRARRMR